MDLARAGSVVAMLDHWAKATPDKVYARYLVDGETEGDVWTFAEMRQRALTLAAAFAKTAQPGDRALLVYPQGLEFIAAYLACMYAGIVAVPVVPPASPKYVAKLLGIVQDCEPKLLLTDTPLHTQLKMMAQMPEAKAFSDGLIAISHATDKVKTATVAFEGPHLSRDDLAFLQYTSGSTGSPKGVMVTHGNLLTDQAMMYRAFNVNQDTVQVSWAPHYHDMGLIGAALTPCSLGSTLVVMSPMDFVANPLRWLAALTKYKGTLTGGPNFGYELCVKRCKDEEIGKFDLSALKVAYNGAEPIRLPTLERFTEKFGKCGFKVTAWNCCYGLAESTLLVSGGGSGAGIKASAVDPEARDKQVVHSGSVFAGQTLLIVDPQSHAEVVAGQIGEVWIHGDHIAAGYWGKPSDTLKTFAARLTKGAPANVEKRYLRTGDLATLVGDQLAVCGRLKDLIIHNGRNIYPQDIEVEVEKAAKVIRPGCAIAFALQDSDGGEGVGVVAEVQKDAPESALADVVSVIKSVVSTQFLTPVIGVALIRQGTLPKTSSGKLQRREARSKYLAGKLDLAWTGGTAPTTSAPVKAQSTPVRPRQQLGVDASVKPQSQPKGSPARRSSDIESFLTAWIAKTCNVTGSHIATDGKLSDFGLDSVAAIELQTAVKQQYGVLLPERAVFDYNSIVDLSKFISERLEHVS